LSSSNCSRNLSENTDGRTTSVILLIDDIVSEMLNFQDQNFRGFDSTFALILIIANLNLILLCHELILIHPSRV
jgi:hypothetical protein